jgi:cell division protein FtsA
MSKTVFVLDIGTKKTSCLAATLEGSRVRVVAATAVTTRGVKKGRVVDPEALQECIKIAVSRLREESGLEVKSLVVGIPGHAVNSEVSRGIRPMYPPGREVHEEDLLHVNEHSLQIRFPEGFELLNTLACEYRIDGNPVDKPLGHPANRLEVSTHVLSGKTDTLTQLKRVVQVSSAEVEQFVPTALASGVAVEAGNGDSIVIDLGGGKTDAAVFRHGVCTKVATVDANADHVTNDIATLIKISKEDAEALKIAHGHANPSDVGEDETVDVKQVGNETARAFPRKVLSEIIESRVREIATLVREALLDDKQDLPKTVLLTGGGSQLQGVDEVFKRVFQADSVKAVSPQQAGGNSSRSAVPEMACAVGLARFALTIEEEDLAPVAGSSGWKERMKSLLKRP